VPDQVIDEIRRREVRGVVELPKPPGLEVGDRVRVTRGPLVGLTGLYQGMNGRQRVDILLSILGGACRVTLAKSDVAALG
jgi:transcription antitermination factor NusG